MPKEKREEGAEPAGAQPEAEALAPEGAAARTEPAPEAEAPKAVPPETAEAEEPVRAKADIQEMKTRLIELGNRAGGSQASLTKEMGDKVKAGEELRQAVEKLAASVDEVGEGYETARQELASLSGRFAALEEALELLKTRPDGGIKSKLKERLAKEQTRLEDLESGLNGGGTEVEPGPGMRKRLVDVQEELKRLATEMAGGKSNAAGHAQQTSKMQELVAEQKELEDEIAQAANEQSAVRKLIEDLKVMVAQKLDEEKDVQELRDELRKECETAREAAEKLNRQLNRNKGDFDAKTLLLETNGTEVAELRERLLFVDEVNAAVNQASELIAEAEAVLGRKEKIGPRFANIEQGAAAALENITRVAAGLRAEIDVALAQGHARILDQTGVVKGVRGQLDLQNGQLESFLAGLELELATFEWDSGKRRESRPKLERLEEFCAGFDAALEAAKMNTPDMRGLERELAGLIDGANKVLAKRDPAVVAAELGVQIKALQNAGQEKVGLEAQNASLRRELDQKQKILEKLQADFRKANDALATAQSKEKPAAPNGHGLELKQNALRELAAGIKDVLEGRKDRKQLLEQYSGQSAIQEMLQMIFAGHRDALVARRLVKMASARSVADLPGVVQKLTGVSADGTVVVSGAASGEEELSRGAAEQQEGVGARVAKSWRRFIRRE